MNYIAEIKAFQELVQVKSLSTGQIALWYALMAINNTSAWVEWFTVANLSLQLRTGLSREGILKARNVLKQLNLIDFKSNGTKATSYKMFSLLMANSTQNSTQDSTQNSTQNSAQNSTTLNKQNKTKQNNKEKEEKEKRFSPPSLSDVQNYIDKMGYKHVDASSFISFYESKGWLVGKSKMEDWQASLSVWGSRSKTGNPNNIPRRNKFNNFSQRQKDYKELERMEAEHLAESLKGGA